MSGVAQFHERVFCAVILMNTSTNMNKYRQIMWELELWKLVEFAVQAFEMAEASPPVSTEAELMKLPQGEVIDLVMAYAPEEFAELWEMQNEGSDGTGDEDDADDEDMMHPDESDDEFYEHEAPDKD